MVMVLNRLELPQGMHAPFVAAGALVTFGLAEALHGSGFLAVYIAGLIVGNRETRAHNTIVTSRWTPPPGSPRSPCSCCSACWPGRSGCRSGSCRR